MPKVFFSFNLLHYTNLQYTNIQNIGDKQYELELLKQDSKYDLIGIKQSGWKEFYDWNNWRCNLFRKKIEAIEKKVFH